MDLRMPIGALFLLFGTIIGFWGIWAPRAIYKASLGYDVNLDWGIVMVAFGVFMLAFAMRTVEENRVAAEAAAKSEEPRS